MKSIKVCEYSRSRSFHDDLKLHMEHPWEGGKKVYINGQGHMTKMAAMAINRKTFKNLFQNQKVYDFETWHEASGNGALQSLYKS